MGSAERAQRRAKAEQARWCACIPSGQQQVKRKVQVQVDTAVFQLRKEKCLVGWDPRQSCKTAS